MASKKNRRQLHKIKKNRAGVSIFFFVLILAAVYFTLWIILEIMGDALLSSKLGAEYKAIEYMAKIYERGLTSGEDVSQMLAMSGREYFVIDENGQVISGLHKSTCSMQEGQIQLMGMTEYVKVYLDSDSAWLDTGRSDLQPDYKVILSRMLFATADIDSRVVIDVDTGEQISVDDEVLLDEKLDEETDSAYKTIVMNREQFPVWFSIPLSDSDHCFVAKAVASFGGDEMALAIVLIIVAVALLLILLVLMIGNIIRNARSTKKIVKTYMTDAVTQGHNWAWFTLKEEPILRGARYANQKIAVIELEFDNYRNFCTCHSMLEGEQMLCKIYEETAKTLTKREAVAHVAMDSFAILMEYENEESLTARLRSLIETLENIDRTHKFAFHLGVRLLDIERKENGKAVRRKKLNLEEEFNNASTARLTLTGIDDSRIAFFDQKLVDEKKWIDAVTEHQEQAIKNEEFVVYYQPKYDPKTKRLRGAEALIRWDSPELGFIPPGKFIPIFEKNGFITEIDHYMLKHVAEDQKNWLDLGLNCVTVSVNISRAHFIESDLAEQIRMIVDKAGAPHNLIEIELTESAFFDDKRAMINTITRLKEYGFTVSMDDFGAGYSSLNSLKDMPLDVLRLDADFFRGETEGGRGEKVVTEAIKLAKSLNMHAVAEGVEEKGQVEFLAGLDCDMIQGYFFSEPLPKEKYVESMRSGISEKAKEFEMPEDADQTDVTGQEEDGAGKEKGTEE